MSSAGELHQFRHLLGHSPQSTPSPRWHLSTLQGRLTEISGIGSTGQLTAAATLLYQAQVASEPVLWLTSQTQLFFPPDLEERGIDIEALLIGAAPSFAVATKAAVKALQSEAFGLVVFDIFAQSRLPTAMAGKLTKLAQSSGTAVVFLTENSAAFPSLGSLISLRVEPQLTHIGNNQYQCAYRVLKDKRHGPTWSEKEVFNGPAGLR